MSEIPIELEKAICNDNLLVFVGAGLSYDFKNLSNEQLKGWSNLVERVLIDLKGKGFDVDHLIPLVKKYDPIKVLDLIESDQNIPKKEIYDFVNSFFNIEPGCDFQLHKKLYQLSKKIITTNYDNAFEIAVPELRTKKAYKGRNYALTKHKDSNSLLLFKLHGCFEDPDSMVLFPSSYKDLYENQERDAEHSLLVLRNIVMNKSILFIGTGMGDFQINNIFQQIGNLQGEYNQKHFIITTSRVLDSSLKFLTPLFISDYSQTEDIIDGLIQIKNDCLRDESLEIKELRRQLKDAETRIAELENTSNKDNLLEREALKYLTKGVEFSMSNEPLEAIQKYRTALELRPDLYQALNNLGADLSRLGLTKTGAEAEDLFNQALDKYQKAIDIKPDYLEAFVNSGIGLSRLALTKTGAEAEDLFNQAFDKYQKAADIKPEKHETFYNWGTDLVRQALTKSGAEAEGLFNQAFDKYQKAIDMKPDYHDAFDNWGVGLISLAKIKTGKKVKDLLLEAIDKHKKAVEFGSNPYNYSCALVANGQKEEALKYLEITLSNQQIEVGFVENDEDWKSLSDDEEFINLLNNYRS